MKLVYTFPRIIVCAAFVALTSCATPPEKIKPQPAPVGSYAALDCQRLDNEMSGLTDRISAASAAQRRAADGDFVGVFLIGVPVSSLSGGDREPEIAALLGQANEVAKERQKKGCKVYRPR